MLGRVWRFLGGSTWWKHLLAYIPLVYYATRAETRTEMIVLLCPLVVIYLGIEKLFGEDDLRPVAYPDDEPGDAVPRSL